MYIYIYIYSYLHITIGTSDSDYASNGDISLSKPIADVYEATTVLFADLAGLYMYMSTLDIHMYSSTTHR